MRRKIGSNFGAARPRKPGKCGIYPPENHLQANGRVCVLLDERKWVRDGRGGAWERNGAARKSVSCGGSRAGGKYAARERQTGCECGQCDELRRSCRG